VSRARRLFGLVLVASGAAVLLWVVVVWQWQDPFTALYTHFQQRRLATSYEEAAVRFRARSTARRATAQPHVALAAEARAYGRRLKRGGPVGRLRIPRIGLNMVVVEGTDDASLRKGPGRYRPSGLPGEGALIYVAGHRTTYLAPFAQIDAIRRNDSIVFEVPYGTFTYRVVRHYVVPADDLAVLRDRGSEVLRLQACHPRFFATHRYLVDARLVHVRR
jgi:sortase A